MNFYLSLWYVAGLFGAWACIAAFRCGGLAGPWTRGQAMLVLLIGFFGPITWFMAALWWICALFENSSTAVGRWWNKTL